MKLLHAQATPTTRLWLTRWVFALWGLHFLFYPVERLALFPQQYYAPSGLLFWLPESATAWLFSENGLFFARLLGIAACAACLAPQWFRYASIVVCLLITLEQSHVRGFSWHMNHTEVNLMFAAYLLCLFAWADRWQTAAESREKSTYNADAVPLFMIALVLCATYFFVGMTRLVFGGWRVFWDDSIINATLVYGRQPWYIDFNLGEPMLRLPWMGLQMKIGFVTITALEIAAPLCLVSRWFRYVFLVALMGFHVLIMLTMKIPFLENVLLMAFLVEWNRRRPAPSSREAALACSRGR